MLTGNVGINPISTKQGREWFVLLLKVGILGMTALARLTSGDEIQVPSANLLCISDCATCPVICSPPPPPLLTSYPPPPPLLTLYPSPSPVVHHPPPQSSYHSPRSSAVPPPPPPVPSSYSSKGTPPPPFTYYYNMPPGQWPPTSGPHEYPYPYYYYYASKASDLPFAGLFLACIVFVFQCCVVFY